MKESLITVAQTMSSLQIAELTGKRHIHTAAVCGFSARYAGKGVRP